MSYKDPHFFNPSTKQAVFFDNIKSWRVNSTATMKQSTINTLVVLSVFTGGLSLIGLLFYKRTTILHAKDYDGRELVFHVDKDMFFNFLHHTEWRSNLTANEVFDHNWEFNNGN